MLVEERCPRALKVDSFSSLRLGQALSASLSGALSLVRRAKQIETISSPYEHGRTVIFVIHSFPVLYKFGPALNPASEWQ